MALLICNLGVRIIRYSVGIFRQIQLLHFTGVFICISSYMFRPLIWPSSGCFRGVYFLFTLYTLISILEYNNVNRKYTPLS
jgi:hypothetical protein